MSSDKTSKRATIIQVFLKFSAPLLLGVLLALIWANVDHESYHKLVHFSPFGEHHFFNFHFLINDIFMAFFFALATKEIVEATLPNGALNPIKKAVNPILGTLGGVLGPVGVYFIYIYLTGSNDITKGWAIPTATDIALAWLFARIIFGASHPAVSFLLLLAIVDDGIGLGIIAVFYPDPYHPVQPIFLLLVVAGMLVAYILKKRNVQNFWLYIIAGGTLSWFGLYLTHLHPALSLIPIIPFLPSAKEDIGLFKEGFQQEKLKDPLNKFEHSIKTYIDFGLFGFGLVNAGVAFSTIGHATWAVLLALAVGKTVGITLFSGIGVLLGFPMPTGMKFKALFVASMIAGIGMTVALFVAGVAFDAGSAIQGAAKMGALFSFSIAFVAIIAAKILNVKLKANEEVKEPVID